MSLGFFSNSDPASVALNDPCSSGQIDVGAQSRAAERRARAQRLSSLAKRSFDVALAVALLIGMLPVMLLIAVAIRLESPGPVLFRVRRVGYRGRTFWMLKFRKMHLGASGGPLTTEGDQRLTRVGRFLTRTRLAELPQFWDVLRGRMSIIGPRPEDATFVEMHPQSFEHITRVRPGITGITQLAFANERELLDPDDPVGDYVRRILPRKVELDMLYARRRSIVLDLAVLIWTLRVSLTGCSVAVNRSTARLTRRKPRSHGHRGRAVATDTL